jgi:hypothetical protein
VAQRSCDLLSLIARRCHGLNQKPVLRNLSLLFVAVPLVLKMYIEAMKGSCREPYMTILSALEPFNIVISSCWPWLLDSPEREASLETLLSLLCISVIGAHLFWWEACCFQIWFLASHGWHCFAFLICKMGMILSKPPSLLQIADVMCQHELLHRQTTRW